MKSSKHPIAPLKFLILLLLSCLFYPSLGQNNIIKGSPVAPIFGKYDFSYEWIMAKNWSANVDLQVWNQNDNTSAIGANSTTFPVNDIHTGKRLSLGLRHFKIIRSNTTLVEKIYVGIGVFKGNHFIAKTESAYTVTTSTWNLFNFGPDFINTEDNFSRKYGELDLISKGISLSGGFQGIWKDIIVFELELRTGRSWNNQNINSLTLYPDDPNDEIKETNLNNQVSGFFVEPKLSIGIMF